ncbi:cell wall hydrolase [Devosia sediminis]|uniref:Cell wall hydrolase n=1 Tax=Devosia sediminis TaxID=2798801 RepID=A0A934IQH0_9HYPH|nr:cell wall hydrolase [Devosia sediminis]MBJ3784943.1 cell wall hydrolase [Devosia sediminis]
MAFVAPVAYICLAGSAVGPASFDLGDAGLPNQDQAVAIAVAKASLTYSGVDPVITGSVNHLFESSSFTGPNRAEKTDRVRPAADAVAIAQSFQQARMQIAALRGPADPAALSQTSIADAGADETADAGPRMSVASLAPAGAPTAPGQSAETDGVTGPRMSTASMYAPASAAPAEAEEAQTRVDVAAVHPNAASALDAIARIAPKADGETLTDVTMPVSVPEQLAYARANTPATEDLMTGGMATGETMNVSDKELWCLATAIYFEARGETYRGQVAVAQVVLNRVKDHRYPDTICGVVFQNQNKRNACQFSFACDGIPETVTERRPWEQAEDIAAKITKGEIYLTEVGDATHYHATYVRPAWAPRMTKVTQVGLHVFYKFKRGWLFG